MFRVVVPVALTILSLSCSSSTGPVATASATVTSVAIGEQGSVDARLDVELSNTTSADIRLAPCAMSLERETVSGHWEEVWSLACALSGLDEGLLLPAGSSKSISVRITAQSATTWPADGVDGTYRLRVYFFPSDAAIKRMSWATNLISAKPVVSNEFAF